MPTSFKGTGIAVFWNNSIDPIDSRFGAAEEDPYVQS
jgi:hypothetical protein